MNSAMRQDPWSVVPRLQEESNRLFGNTRENDSSSAMASWIPAVDIHEYADRFELYVDLPGIEPGTVELTLDGGILTLSGNRLEQAASKRGRNPNRGGSNAVTATFIVVLCYRIPDRRVQVTSSDHDAGAP